MRGENRGWVFARGFCAEDPRTRLRGLNWVDLFTNLGQSAHRYSEICLNLLSGLLRSASRSCVRVEIRLDLVELMSYRKVI